MELEEKNDKMWGILNDPAVEYKKTKLKIMLQHKNMKGKITEQIQLENIFE